MRRHLIVDALRRTAGQSIDTQACAVLAVVPRDPSDEMLEARVYGAISDGHRQQRSLRAIAEAARLECLGAREFEHEMLAITEGEAP